MATDTVSTSLPIDDVIATAAQNIPEPSQEDGENALKTEAFLNETQEDLYAQAKIDLLRQQIENEKQNRRQREKFARKSFTYLYWVSGFVGIILITHGFKVYGFTLPDQVLTTLAGGTFASAVGLAGFVVKGLFSPKDNTNKKI